MNELFKAIPVASMPLSKGHVVTIPSDSSLMDAARILFVNKVHAAPVVDISKAEDCAWNEKYIGIVDLIGIVCAIIEKSPEPHHRPKTFEEYLARNHPHMVKTVKDAMGTWRWGPFIPLEDTATMLDAMLLLSKYQVHRLPVVTSGHDIVNMITQSNVVELLASKKEELASINKKTLTELGLADPQKVFTVPIASKTIEAFRLIAEQKVSAVGVLGANGMLIGTVSATDIRLMIQHPELFSLLNEELRVFYESSRLTQPNIMNPAIRCSPHDTLERVIDLLNGTHIHRVFVVDPSGKPIRVLSLCDVIVPFVTEPEGYFGNYFVHGIPAGQVGL